MIFGQKLKPKGVPILMDIITLLKDFVSGLLQVEENFLGDLNTFPDREQFNVPVEVKLLNEAEVHF